ncbi:unnamed protein product [Rotaria sordida]|uniref:Uncharacterized protein n=1 Tax=Rotaria sordida TaxID=392033 RepID=A0A813S9K3_9BILA|nr:unnamed protein product [Rotaria sordida]CAF0782728.1 unnamed protein product [Rotaria sordida]CAF0784051.1 unnamed protein product [Rotaria sordida]CAF0793159.1 unnamed protein product [Rotaria sordida]CAF0822334.1 unnamed protein product [Rotaria sordida]
MLIRQPILSTRKIHLLPTINSALPLFVAILILCSATFVLGFICFCIRFVLCKRIDRYTENYQRNLFKQQIHELDLDPSTYRIVH